MEKDIVNQNEEARLINLAKNGDLVAFEKILFIYEKPIYNYIRRLVKQTEDAEDLTQKTFIKLFQSSKSADAEKKFKSWIYKIATNTVYDWFRKRKRSAEVLMENYDIRAETIADDEAYYNIDSLIDLENALAKIKPAYKSILLLYYKNGLKYQEIAEILNLPLNTVKTHLRRAKLALKNELSDYIT